jgi:hypothetical protein
VEGSFSNSATFKYCSFSLINYFSSL